MRLRLWIAPEEADDADLFVGIEKLSTAGEVVGFSGVGVRNDVVAKGWLRLSHRELDEAGSTETQPLHPDRRMQKVAPGQATLADVEVLPSSTMFEAGSSLRLVVQGHELRDYPALGHSDLVNRGRHRLFTGGRYDAFLTMPEIEARTVDRGSHESSRYGLIRASRIIRPRSAIRSSPALRPVDVHDDAAFEASGLDETQA
jgi:predicted acyl esterase